MNIKKFKKNDFVIRVDENDNSRDFKFRFSEIIEKKSFSNNIVLDKRFRTTKLDKDQIKNTKWVNYETFKKDFVKDHKIYNMKLGDIDHIQNSQVIQIGTSHNKSLVITSTNFGWEVEIWPENYVKKHNEMANMQEFLEDHISRKTVVIYPIPKENSYNGKTWVEQPSESEIEHAEKSAEEKRSKEYLEIYTNEIQALEDLVHTIINDDQKLETFMEFNLIGKFLPKYNNLLTSRFKNNLGVIFDLEKGEKLEIPKKYIKETKEEPKVKVEEKVEESNMGMRR